MMPPYQTGIGDIDMNDSPREGSHFAFDVEVERNVWVLARDGAMLATDIYYPAISGKRVDGAFPVVLERTPYLKQRTSYHRKGSFYARLGYVMAIQDVRGRGESGGEWYPFAEEAEDGCDTVEWLAAQPFCTGKVGTVGTSYSGSDQSALATLNPTGLAAQFISMGASNYHDCSMRHNGCLEQRFIIYAFQMGVWSKQAAAGPMIKAAMIDACEHIDVLMTQLPVRKGRTPLKLTPNIEQWVLDIQNRGDYDDYWRKRGLSIEHYWDEQADVPTLFFGGWYDSYARATTTNYRELRRRKKSPIHLVMGPWTHGDPTCEISTSGETDFGPEAAQDIYHRLPLRFFDTYLKGLETGLEGEDPVRIFVMGGGDGRRNPEGFISHGGKWRSEANWPIPKARSTEYFLHGDGGLSTGPPSASNSSAEWTTFLYDPNNPVPTIGGSISAANVLMTPGGYDQRGCPVGSQAGYTHYRRQEFYSTVDDLPLAARNDVLVFQTEPLKHPVEITGPIVARLWISSTAVDTDFTVKIVDVVPPNGDYPLGFDLLLTDSIQRCRYRDSRETPTLMTPGEVYKLEFELYPISNLFGAGHRIRVDVSSSNWPRFDANPNTGEPLGKHRSTRSALNTVHHGPACPSCVVFSVVGSGTQNTS
jgi:hypothetical protein